EAAFGPMPLPITVLLFILQFRSTMRKDDGVEILLVEDNPDDAGLTIRALEKHNLAKNLLHLHDGEEALNYLFSDESLRIPKVILLDLKMPKVDGIEVLRKL